MKILTSFSVISAPEGKRVSYTYSELDANGNLVKSNVRESFIAMDADLLTKITDLENIINLRINPIA